MKKLSMFFVLGLALTMSGFGQAPAKPMAQATPAPPTMTLKVGDMAPDFSLPDTTGKQIKLTDFRGKKNVVLAFYVLAFTGG